MKQELIFFGFNCLTALVIATIGAGMMGLNGFSTLRAG
jgi:hypothetical protein